MANQYYRELVCGSASVVSKWIYRRKCGATSSDGRSSTAFESLFRKMHAAFTVDLKNASILLFDGRGSHLTYVTFKCVIDNNIIIF